MDPGKMEKNEIGKVHKVSYLTHLLTEDYIPVNCLGSIELANVMCGMDPGNMEKNEIGKVHKVSYLTHLLTEDYINDISQILYGRHFKVIDFIPFEEITKVIPNDMEVQYNDKTVGKKGNTELMYNDSANWYNDHKNFNMNDVITDDSGGYSRSQFDAWLVVKQEGKLGLCMFPMSDGDWDNGFSDGDSINNRGEMIHPITRKLVKIGLF